ncbi:antitoxin Xre/MbcA/ParS toxin-binding domain-containing protein [Chitinophaga sp. YIM B06452]|uniref:antitoxin Xre/MbcA/ParS toxin-binding domain-containing protein n=1 Tax=Chitinophaga sp. YIM B06452 TaxID=3082158 RepID=UPI0031FEE56B
MNSKPDKAKSGAGKKAAAARKPVTDGHDMLVSYESIVKMQKVLFTKKIEVVKSGVTKEQLTRLKEIFELDYDTLSALLVVTNRSLHLKKGKDILNRNISDRIIAIADVFSLGYNVFNSRELFHRWLRQPSRDLGGVVPLAMLDTITGMEEVKQQLMRMEMHS